MDDPLAPAFTRLTDTMSQPYRRMLHGAGAAVAEPICGPAYATDRDMTLIVHAVVSAAPDLPDEQRL